MDKIEISVRDRIAWQTNRAEYVCANKGEKSQLVEFKFDSEWDGIDPKTAKFTYGGEYQDVVFTGNVCEVPYITDTTSIECGVFAGDLITTTPAVVGAKRSILCGSGLPADPAPDVYNQIMGMLANIEAGGVSITDDGNGNVTVSGISVTDDGAGNVTIG